MNRLASSLEHVATESDTTYGLSMRDLHGIHRALFFFIATFFSLFYLYTAGPAFFGRPSVGTYRGLFLLLALTMVFLLYPARASSNKKRPTLTDAVFVLITLVPFGYFIVEFDALVHRVGYFTTTDFYMALLASTACIEATRRVIGLTLPVLCIAFLFYAVYGNLLPVSVSHRGYSWDRVLTDMFSLEGMFGLVLEVTANYVVLFVIFGALMNRFGAGDFFVRLPLALTSGFRGGPAKAAVIGSGMMGMISGSATANTAATGVFTIPMMIKAGFKRHVAGAIEPAASTGGMFMPPVMGAAVFIMAEMIGMPYTQIMIVSLVPALLYFFSVACVVHFEALKCGISTVPKDERENPWQLLRGGWHFIVPIALVIYLLLSGMSPSRAIFYTIISFLVIAFAVRLLKKDGAQSNASAVKHYFIDLALGLEEGARNALVVSALVGTVGIILGIVFLTGIGFIFTTTVMQFTFGLLPLAIVLALFASYILGMGMTVTSAYILMAILIAPALEVMGISALAAHMLVFWYSQSSNISPPVCMAAFVGASIAKAGAMKTGFTALKFAAFLFIIPVLFVYTPILMPEGLTWQVAHIMITSFIAVIAAAASLSNYFLRETNIIERGGLFMAAALLLFPQIIISVSGLALLVLIFFVQMRTRRPVEAPSENA